MASPAAKVAPATAMAPAPALGLPSTNSAAPPTTAAAATFSVIPYSSFARHAESLAEEAAYFTWVAARAVRSLARRARTSASSHVV
eukprot:CAMPEP_0196197092 /NCGR_PEP_ID=MMETSP0912-20130531/1682_1 /TAXON_ID=49265 /ORGANISM="Thalassiosira rotula, Strain GSO102" /LENGTH=85 /DNA_ID=CAMNT_0041469907 /DNA_START=247 /DNA_END=504 /DNA_ORIENTATION=-